jgi:hypothetical protein
MLPGSLRTVFTSLLLIPAASTMTPCAAYRPASPVPYQLAQAGGIKGQNPETGGKGEGNTGWVQAPVPRGHNQPEQTAQGAGAAPVGSSGRNLPQAGNQPSPGQNPGTPVTRPVPGPSGMGAEPAAK